MERTINLDIDTDVVLAEFGKIKEAIEGFETTGISDFNLTGAWESGNANTVAEKVEEISNSIASIKEIIGTLQKKVESYVSNVVASDTVNFNSGNSNPRNNNMFTQ